ncbi:MAG: hypothetical protein IJW07_04125, partial [Lentisphaeria bacterium]|nr:hypothetical protein [Lentisphaeria bacterium]
LLTFFFSFAAQGITKNAINSRKSIFFILNVRLSSAGSRQISIFFAFYKYNGLNLNIKGVLL